MNKKYLLLLLLTAPHFLSAHVLVMTQTYNRPDFIEIQYHTLKKFLKDEYEFVVFNDAPTEAMCNQITEMCVRYNIRCIRIPQEIHTYDYLPRLPRERFNHPCVRCANAVQYSLNELGLFHDDLVMIIDSDMFLVKDFSLREYMKECTIAGVSQSRPNGVEYIWNGLVFFDMKQLPNKDAIDFNCGEVNNTPVDVGGQMHHYFKQNPEVRVRFIHQDYVANHASKSEKELKKMGFDAPMILFIKANPPVVELYEHAAFVHYRSGTNWDGKSAGYHKNKTIILQELVHALLSS